MTAGKGLGGLQKVPPTARIKNLAQHAVDAQRRPRHIVCKDIWLREVHAGVKPPFGHIGSGYAECAPRT